MLELVIMGSIITLIVGAVWKHYLDSTGSQYRITRNEFVAASVVMLLIVIPLTSFVGVKMAINNQVVFQENRGGYEVSAEIVRTACYRDGSMKHYYMGDRERVWVDTSYTDSKGKRHKQGHYKTVDHRIPYTTEEWTFVVKTTLGDYTIADRNLPTNPNLYRYRWLVNVPGHLPAGVPDRWQQVKDRLDRGEYGPVTARFPYDNYVLASQKSILRRYSDSIGKYRASGQLPRLNSSIYDFYFSDRVYGVGVSAGKDWQEAINRFNAAFGHFRQGDLHLVLIEAGKISNPDNYINALAAYWQSPEFEKDAFAKNGVLVVLGVDATGKIVWARATTGMPMGNERMLLELSQVLPGQMAVPEAVLGSPRAVMHNGSLSVSLTDGALEKLFWTQPGFQRVRMKEHPGSGNGFAYLMRELEPTTGQKVLILFFVMFFAGVAWGCCVYYGTPVYRRGGYY